MRAAELIRLAALDGVHLHRSPTTEKIQVVGGKVAVDRWISRVREKEEEIVSLLMEREERAAIYEYDAKFSRRESELKAGLPGESFR